MQKKTFSQTQYQSELDDGAILNGDRRPYNSENNIINMFYNSASRRPNSAALTHENVTCTYAELNARSNRLGRFLQDLRLPDGSYIPLIMDRGIDAIVAILGILKSSSSYVPLSPDYPAERIQYILEDCNSSCVITSSEHIPVINTIVSKMDRKLTIICMDELPISREESPDNILHYDRSDMDEYTSDNLDVQLSPGDHAYVIYTSGTTGKPKGVVNVHTNIVNMSLWCEEFMGLNETSRYLQLAALTFDVSVAEIFPPLISGGHIHIIPQSQKQSLEDLLDRIAHHGVTLLSLPPSLIYQLDDIIDPGSETRLRTLRILISGGEKLLIGRIKNFLKLSETGHLRVLNVYGPTETTVLSTAKWIDPNESREVGLLGKPIFNEQIYIVDENLGICARGETGEIVIGGACVANGYLNDPEKTEASFIPNPFGTDNSRVYRTGDLGRILDSGDIEFVGRKDEQVKVRGFRIELGEIETVLGRHPGVKHAVVHAQEEDGGHKRLIAYIIPASETLPPFDDLRRHILAELPEFMVPGYFQTLKEFPLNPNGKVDRKKLPRVEVFERQEGGEAYREPQTEMEKEVAEIWKDLLKVNRISIDDNFFSLGGDSIISIQVVSRLNRLGYKVKTPQLFKNPVLKDFAAQLSPATIQEKSTPSFLEEEDLNGPVMPSPTQLWFFEKEFRKPDYWHQSVEFEIREEMKSERIARVMDMLVRHHPMLRSRYTRTPAGINFYVVPDPEPIHVNELDLTLEEDGDKENKRIEFCNLLRSDIKMDHPPLMRVGLVRLDSNLFHFVWIIHHTIVDTVSWKILLDQFRWLYDSMDDHDPVTLPARTLSYSRYSRMLFGMLEDKVSREKLEREIRYWKRFLTDPSWKSSFHHDSSLNELTHADSKIIHTELDVDMTELLVGPAHECYNTRMPDLLLSALFRALTGLIQSENMAVQLEGHGRERDMDLTETVGWFTTLFPFFMTIPRGQSVSDTIIHVKENRNAIPENGNNFLLLRYGAHEPHMREIFRNYADPDVVFNYHGRFDASDLNENWKSLSPTGPNFHPENQAPYKMNMESWIANDRLHTEFIYSDHMYETGEMQRFVERYNRELTHIIRHCLEPKNRTRTPSDFDLVRLTMDDIRQLPASMEDVYELSSMQNGMLFRYMLNRDTHAYHIQTIYDIEESIDVSLMERAFNILVKEYSILRTIFLSQDLSIPVQVVMPFESVPVEEVDLSGLRTGEQNEFIQKYHEEDLARSFDPAKGRLNRIKFFRLSEKSYRMSWVFHHIILDGWSYGMLRHRWMANYAALKRGETIPAGVETGTFRNFIEFHLRQLNDESSRQFWKEQLADAGHTMIPTDHPRRKNADYTVQALRRDLTDELKEKLKRYSSSSGLTLNEISLAAYLFLLHILSDSKDIIAGIVVSGRAPELPHSEFIMGLLINSVPFRVRIKDSGTFSQFVSTVRDVLLNIKEHENFPLTEIIKLSDEIRDTGRGIFEHLFDYEKYPDESPMPGMPDLRLSGGFEVTEYEISLQVIETDSLTVQFSYAVELFEKNTIEQWFRLYEKILTAIVERPEEKLARFEYLSEDQKTRVNEILNKTDPRIEQIPLLSYKVYSLFIPTWSSARTDYPRELSVKTQFETIAALHGDRTAVIENNPQTQTTSSLIYSDLNRKANQLARHLQKAGVQTDDAVGINMERSIDYLVSILAVIKAGGVYVPMDSSYPDERLSTMIGSADCRYVIGYTSEQNRSPFQNIRFLSLDGERDAISGLDGDNLPTTTRGESGLYIMFTSGSTGIPKGVLIPHRAVTRLVINNNFIDIQKEDVFAHHSNVSFDASTLEIWGPLLHGACMVMLSREIMLDADQLKNEVEKHGVTSLWLTAALFNQFVKHDLSYLVSLRFLMTGGEAADPDAWRQFLSYDLPCKLINGYGPTESTTFAATYHTRHVDEDAAGIPIGKPIGGTVLHILDGDLNPSPVGSEGELYIGGDGLAIGYVNNKKETNLRFINNPFSDGERLYRTGDLVRWRTDGNIEYLGRIDQQVKIRGQRIEPGEIENILRESDLLKDCIVVPLKIDQRGPFLAAYGIPESEEKNKNDLRRILEKHLKLKLPDYMIPQAFVFLDEFPLNANGKIDRRALPVPEWTGAEDFVAPQTKKEIILSEIWSEVLGVKEPGIDDSFFEMGGDSILSIQIASRARQHGLKLNVAQIFQHKTIRSLAENAQFDDTLVREEESYALGQFPAGPVQQWFFHNNHVNPHRFNQSFLFAVEPAVNSEHIRTALNGIYGHHDILRARYIKEGERYVHHVTEMTEDFPLTIVRATGSEQSDDINFREQCEKAVNSIHIFDGPLCGAVYLEKSDQSRLYMVIHHLVVDTVSWRILIEDIVSMLEAPGQKKDTGLPRKTTSFRHWLEKINEYAASATLQREIEYWKEIIQAPVTPLPLDYKNGENLVRNAKVTAHRFSAEETESLLREVPSVYNTRMNDILLSAVGRALTNWIAAESVLIDLEGHGREELFDDVDVSRTIGWFTTIFPVKLNIPAGISTKGLIQSVKEQLRAVPANGIGYGILRYLADERTAASVSPQREAEVSFNYLGQFDASGEKSIFQILEDRSELPSDHGMENRRDHLLDIVAYIAGGKLNLEMISSTSLHEPQTMETLLTDIADNLKMIIGHCLSDQAGGHTPSDFPMADLTQDEVDSITADPDVVDIYPMSPIQEGLLFQSLYVQGGGVYVTQLHWRMTGNFNVNAFLRSWKTVLERHEALRSSFRWDRKGIDLQIIRNNIEMPHEIVDRRDLSPDEFETSLQELLKQDRNRGYDMKTPPLMRLYIIRESENTYRILWSHHHILLDGWCLGIIFHDLFETYLSITLDRKPALDRPVPYKNHIQSLITSDSLPAERFWKQIMEGFESSTKLQLPGDKANIEHRLIQRELSATISDSLRHFARNHSLTLNTLIQSTLAILLHRYTDSDDITFGMVSSGRGFASEKIVGLMLNTLPLRLHVPDDQKIIDFLNEVQQRSLRIREHETASPADIRTWAGIRGSDPLFEIILTFENYPLDRSLLNQLEGLTVSDFQGVEQPGFDLNIVVYEQETITIKTVYSSAIMTDRLAERFMDHMENILLSILKAPDSPDGRIRAVTMLSEEERETIVNTWNRSYNMPTSPDGTLTDSFLKLFQNNVKQHPNKTAIMFIDKTLSYMELYRWSSRIARMLVEQGVGRNDSVVILLDRGILAPAAMIGIWMAGCVYVPVDPSYPEDRISHILEQTDAPIVISEKSVLTDLPESTNLLSHRTILDLDDLPEALLETDFPVRQNPNDPAYIIYTSGTTGKPKGIVNTHGNLANLIEWVNRFLPMGEKDRITQFASFSFDVSVAEIYPSLASAGTVVILEQERRGSLIGYMELLKEKQITVTSVPPALLYQLLDLIEKNGEYKDYFRSVKLVICGGDALLSREVSRFQQLFGESPSILNVYGPTETTVLSTAYPVSRPVDIAHPVVSLGNPIDNTRVYILDRNNNLCPESVVGEICIGGAGVASGYFRDADKTNEKFMKDPFANHGNRMYRTGDLGRWMADGSIEFMGRVDHQVKIRGFRVEPAEIETVLIEHESVREAAVAARDDEGLGKRLVAYFTTKEMSEEESSELIDRLRTHLKQSLPEYMVPSAFMRLDELPLTHNGKVNLKALPSPDWQSGRAYTAPRNEMEKKLASIWAEVLQVDKVGIYDNFFEIGGHSILVIQLHGRITAELHVDLPVAQIFQYPTIHSIVEYLDKGNEQKADIIKNRPTMETRKQDRSARRDERRKRHRDG